MDSLVGDDDLEKCHSMLQDSFLDKSWEFLTTANNCGECKIYRKPLEGTSLYQYFATGFFKGVTAQQMFASGIDCNYRKHWDQYALDIEVVHSDSGTDCIYWSCKFPWPLTNRDYVYYRRCKENKENGTYMMVCKGGPHPSKPERNGFIRVDSYLSMLIFKHVDDKTTQFWLLYADDMKGSIPKTIVNWAVASAVPEFLKKAHSACLGYLDWKSKQ